MTQYVHSQDLQRGCFLTLKNQNLVEPKDKLDYTANLNKILKTQVYMLVYGVFTAKLMEVSNLWPKRFPVISLYLSIACLPSMVHGVYVAGTMQSHLDIMDSKYTPLFNRQQRLSG